MTVVDASSSGSTGIGSKPNLARTDGASTALLSKHVFNVFELDTIIPTKAVSQVVASLGLLLFRGGVTSTTNAYLTTPLGILRGPLRRSLPAACLAVALAIRHH